MPSVAQQFGQRQVILDPVVGRVFLSVGLLLTREDLLNRGRCPNTGSAASHRGHSAFAHLCFSLEFEQCLRVPGYPEVVAFGESFEVLAVFLDSLNHQQRASSYASASSSANSVQLSDSNGLSDSSRSLVLRRSGSVENESDVFVFGVIGILFFTYYNGW